MNRKLNVTLLIVLSTMLATAICLAACHIDIPTESTPDSANTPQSDTSPEPASPASASASRSTASSSLGRPASSSASAAPASTSSQPAPASASKAPAGGTAAAPSSSSQAAPQQPAAPAPAPAPPPQPEPPPPPPAPTADGPSVVQAGISYASGLGMTHDTGISLGTPYVGYPNPVNLSVLSQESATSDIQYCAQSIYNLSPENASAITFNVIQSGDLVYFLYR